ncbi:MAG: hypothetical protein CMD04_02890 [Flavobacteriales bacterium]|nr:hypothetical protein [Flavobacteriales bacterium]|tara:strand:+ start:503 stop:835 length:333 start_codon:yes stop_codon:yes gene_type:complete
MSEFLINAGLWITYLMIIGGALTAIIFPIMFLVKNPDKATNILKYIGILVGVILISYLLASGNNWQEFEKFGMTEASTKRVGMGLICFYILAVGAVGAVLYSELGKVFKK